MKKKNSATKSDQATAPQADYDDIQGLMVNGYRGYNYIRFLIFTIPDANIQAVRELCGKLVPGTAGSPLTISAATRWFSKQTTKPPYRLNLGVTNTGLKKLLSSPADIRSTNYETVYNKSYQLMNRFDVGAADPNTALKVGDTGPSAPALWWKSAGWELKGQDPTKTDLDLLFSLYAPSAKERDNWSGQLMKMIGSNSAILAFQQDSDPLDPAGQKIHFGYRDGISQPRIEGFSEADPELDDRPPVASWHFMIEETKPIPPPNRKLPPPPNYTAHPFLKNGSFAAFRLLYQDVKQFEDFINQKGPKQAELIASKMAGRWRDGTPIEVSPNKPENQHLLGQSLLNQYHLNNFDYVSPTPHQEPKPAPLGNPDIGQACPYGAHVRRANPRDDESIIGNVDMASAHRVLRRARPYGPAYNPKDPKSANQDRGLVGLFIGADLSNQFEFLMNTWVTNGHFSTSDNSPNSSGYDPLFGPPPTNPALPPSLTELSYCVGDPTNPSDYETLPGLSQLIVTKGGLYVFLPSISALRHLSGGTIPPVTQ
jgi:Dyp-type peroxidase family